MVKAKAVLCNPLGLHLRPAGIFCAEALKFKCSIFIKKENFTGNGKSILGVLAARIQCGDEFEIICDGEDEEEAVEQLVLLVQNGFGEKI